MNSQMWHRFLFLLTCLTVASAPGAQDVGLRSLENGFDARAWEAVGRLDIGGEGFCTGALIEPDIVLTAAHCLFDNQTGRRIDHGRVEFLAGWRNGRASAYRSVRRAVVHPDYEFDEEVSAERVRNDIALLELTRPIRNTTIHPFSTGERPRTGDDLGVVSYARNRSEAPSLQEICKVLGRQQGILVMSCEVDFGSSGAPIFSFADGKPRIVSVVSAKAEADGEAVSLGASLGAPLDTLRDQIASGLGGYNRPQATMGRVRAGERKRQTGAKFVRP